MSYHKSSTSILSSIDKDYIEEGRRDIYKWGETRSTRRRGVRGWAYVFKKRFIDKSILRSFLNNLTVSLLIQLILSGLCTYICQTLDLYLDVHIALFVSPIIFPLAFSINADFQRREHVLEDLALFKGGLIVLFFCHRDWHLPSGLSQEFLKAVTNKLKGLILNVKEYLLTEKEERRSFILQVIYEDFSDISQMNEKMRVALPDSASLVQRVIHCHNLMFWAFERLRVIREYRSPRGIRSFTKVFIFVMPLWLSPYYVFVGKSSGNTWGPYYISLISTFVFGTLQGVQDVLDDPFDGISEDDINLGSLEDWTAHSLLVNRTYTVGRFTVTASVPQNKEEPKKDSVIIETRNPPSRSVSFKQRVNVPIRSILRRASHRPDMHYDKPDTLSNVSEEDVGVLFPEMALRLNTMKEKGLTGNTTILPGFHIKEQPEYDSNEGSFLNTPGIRRSASDMTELGTRRRAYRSKNVSFSQDLDDETTDNSPERLSESSLNATDSLPLLRDRTEVNKTSESLEPDPDKFSKELLDSMKRLENTSGTERIAQGGTKAPERGIPASLASIFQMPPAASHKDSSSPGKRESPALERPIELIKQDEPKTEEKSPRFSVSKSENNLQDLLKDSVPTYTENNHVPNSSRFAVAPSQSPKAVSPNQSTAIRSPSPNKVKVQLPTKRFQVKPSASPSMSDNEKERLGKTNLGLTDSLSSFTEDPTQTKHEIDQTRPSSSSKPQEDQQQTSRFSVTKPPGGSKPQEDQNQTSRFSVTKPPGGSKPQEDQQQASRFSVSKSKDDNSGPKEDQEHSRFSVSKEPQDEKTSKQRTDSFWDFSTEDSVDGEGEEMKEKSPNRSPSVEDVLRLHDQNSGEVYI